MSIFGKIKDAIFGKAKAATPPSTTASYTQAGRTTSSKAAPQQQAQPVDVEAVLGELASQKGEKLNYQSSIVDLLKLLDIDSSLANRKELASELGYSGAKDGSAEMNNWLHKATMRELAANGGKVPAEMLD